MQEEQPGAQTDSPAIVENSPNSEHIANVDSRTLEVKDPSPADAKPAAPQKLEEDNVPFHKHPRFKELIEDRNLLKDKLSSMERLLQQKFESPKQTANDVAKKKLLSLGVEDKAADELLEAVKLVSSGYTESRVAPIEQAAVQQEIDGWLNEFSRDHKDFSELEPQMYDAFKSLPERTQHLIASDPKGLELLYNHVKMQSLKQELDKSYQKGVQDGYKNKQSKSSMTPGPAGSPNPPAGDITRKAISEMTLDEYKKRRGEIIASMNKLQAEGEQAGAL